MKNLPIRRQMTDRAGAQSQEILHCAKDNHNRRSNRHEESPHPKTNDRSSRYSKSGDPSLRSG